MTDLSKLRENATVFTKLNQDSPDWWKKFKANMVLYIEVRKNNEVHVYYQGGKVAGIKYKPRKKVFDVSTHYKYLGKADYKTYIECSNIIGDQIDDILRRIEQNYSQKHAASATASTKTSKEELSETFIKGKLILKNRNIHLDSEFAFNDEERKVRIDLVKMVDGAITFVELKLINDKRLRHLEKVPEIISQMKDYKDFICQYKDEILDYYKRLYEIKKSLGIPVPAKPPVSVNTEPELLIYNLYVQNNKRRDERIKSINELLEANHIKYKIQSMN